MSNLALNLLVNSDYVATSAEKPVLSTNKKIGLFMVAIASIVLIIIALFGNSNNNNTSNMTGGTPEIPCSCNKNH